MIVKTIGRGSDNNIVVNDENVSRVHIQMVQDDYGNISVVDLGSTNGTFVNGTRITGETHLKPGDEVRIGDTKLPWQQYFHTKQQTPPSIRQTHSQIPKQNMAWIYIIGGVLLVLLFVGGVLIFNIKKENEKVRTELEENKQQRERERNAAGEDYNELLNQKKQTEDILNKTIQILEEHNNHNVTPNGRKGKEKNGVIKKGNNRDNDDIKGPEIQHFGEVEEDGNKEEIGGGNSFNKQDTCNVSTNTQPIINDGGSASQLSSGNVENRTGNDTLGTIKQSREKSPKHQRHNP